MGAKTEKIKWACKHILWVLLGIIYFPIYFAFWVLRFISRFTLAISYYGTFNAYVGYRIMKSLFSKDYERTF